MRRVVCGVIAVLVLFVVAAPTEAEAAPRTLIPPVYAEPDLVEESTALGMLLRSTLGSEARPVVPAADLAAAALPTTMAGAAEGLKRLGADRLLWGQLDRVGPLLVLRATLLDEGGATIASVTGTAQEGEVAKLLGEVLAPLRSALGLEAAAAPDVSLGQLRPFARAERAAAASKWADAAEALRGADPVVAAIVSEARVTARRVWSSTTLPLAARLQAALGGGSPADVLAVAGTDGSEAARIARAWAKLGVSDSAGARAELDGVSPTPDATLARAAVASITRRDDDRDAAMRRLLDAADGPGPMALRWMTRQAAGLLDAALEKKLLLAAGRSSDPRLPAALGLRAAEGGVDVDAALAYVIAVELDRTELGRLKAVLGRAGTGTEADRLRVEVALREGDLAAAKTALANLGLRGNPTRAALYRGRLAWAMGDLGTAATELGRAGAIYDQARVLVAAGESARAVEVLADQPESQLSLLAAADVSLSNGQQDEALARLARAEGMSPAARETQEMRAQGLAAMGDEDGAELAKAYALRQAPPPTVPGSKRGPMLGGGSGAGKTLGGGAGGGGGGAGSGGSSGSNRASGPARTSAPGPLVALIDKMLANVEPSWWRKRLVAVAPLPHQVAGGFSLWKTQAGPLADALAASVMKLQVTGVVPVPDVTEPDVDQVMGIAGTTQARTVVLYGFRSVGGSNVEIELWTIDTTAPDPSTALKHEVAQIDGSDVGMARRNLVVLVPGLAVGGFIFCVLAFLVIRGSGTALVVITLDPSGKDEAFGLRISKSNARPAVGQQPEVFAKAMRQKGQKIRRRDGELVGPQTKFRVPPGRWHIHLYGVYLRGAEARVLDDKYSVEVTVPRGKTITVPFDLTPKLAEIRVRVHDAQPAGIPIWLAAAPDDKRMTSARGEVTFMLPIGEHVLIVSAPGLEFEVPLTIGSTKMEVVEVNLAKERKLAEVSGGKSLKRTMMAGTPPAGTPVVAPPPTGSLPVQLGDAHRPTGATRVGPDGRLEVSMPGLRDALASPAPIAAGTSNATVALAAGSQPAPGIATGATALADSQMLCNRYRILRKLGQGAMGVVFQAHDTNLEREVAIKALESSLKSHPDALRMFIEEAKALAKLHHPNIVSVFDQTSDRGDQYLVMEFVNGRTLDDIITERGTLPLAEALDLADQLCAGLGYAHSKRVIHRDIKPANIFVSNEGVVKVGDFGLARVMRELAIRKTEIRGTPLFMAPEQITGTNVSARADLYAVGGTIFNMVCGRPPFVDGEILYHQLHTAPPAPSSLVPGLPPEFDAVMAQCLEKDPDLRVESAATLRELLKTVPR